MCVKDIDTVNDLKLLKPRIFWRNIHHLYHSPVLSKKATTGAKSAYKATWKHSHHKVTHLRGTNKPQSFREDQLT